MEGFECQDAEGIQPLIHGVCGHLCVCSVNTSGPSAEMPSGR